MWWQLLLCVGAVFAQQPEVQTEYGTVRGQTITLDDGVQVNSFKGIPFAKPPEGELRFEAPQKPDPWTETFVADSLGWACPQATAGVVWMTHPLWVFYREDCLNMNIYTPSDMSGGPYPVMVWFHGGAYLSGANIQYPGHFLAADDVVVVVPNYRLGIFGFLATPDGTLKGNAGMLDQVLALQFVRDNIANFGGDPNQVTSFGQSAGASSTAMHMLSPLSQGLVHQGICQSGADTNLWGLNWPPQSPERYVYQTAAKTGCDVGSDAEIVTCLKSLNWTVVRDNQGINCTDGYFCLGYAPIIDGPGGFMPDYPDVIRESGEFVQGPLMTGITRDEGSLFTLGFIPEAYQGDGFTREEFHFYLKDRLISMFAGQLDEETYDQVFHAIDFYYSPWPHVDDLWDNREAFNLIATDLAFGVSMDRQALWQSPYANTYTYIQGYLPLNASTLIPKWMGVPHGGDAHYTWGYPLLLNNPDVRDDCRIYFDIIGWMDQEYIEYTKYYNKLLTNFAKFGDPTPEPVPAPGSNSPTIWPKFTEKERYYLDVDEEIQVLKDYRSRNLAFWREYISYLADVPVKSSEGKKKRPQSQRRQFDSEKFNEASLKMVIDAIRKSFGEEAIERAVNSV